jgi:hypothetical protein
MLVHSSRLFDFGIRVHQFAAKNGLYMEVAVWDSIVGFYAKCGEFAVCKRATPSISKYFVSLIFYINFNYLSYLKN